MSAPIRLYFHRIHTGGDRFHARLRALFGKKRSGVYVIRNKARRVVYIGESHTGNLYDTATRHFQRWRGGDKTKRYYDHKPGKTYDPAAHRIAVVRTKRAVAVGMQNDLIEALNPRDNEQTPAPF